MRRICLCLLIAVVSTGVAAREVKMSSANGGSCPESSDKAATKRSMVDRDPAPARPSRPRPSLHSDSDVTAGKPGRWHSFLPGMFR